MIVTRNIKRTLLGGFSFIPTHFSTSKTPFANKANGVFISIILFLSFKKEVKRMRIFIYLLIGGVPGFIIGERLGLLCGLIGGLLLYIIEQLNALLEEISKLNKKLDRSPQ